MTRTSLSRKYLLCIRKREWLLIILYHIYNYVIFLAALVPGRVQNLRSTLGTNTPTLTLNWDKPQNMTTDGDITSYHIHFKPCGREGNYCKKIVFPPATSILLTRESGLKPLTKYTFEVRAWSTFREGKWSEVSEYIGMCLFVYIHITVAAMAYI